MKTHLRSRRAICAALGVLVVVSAMRFIAHATPPSAISFTAVGRATLPEFDVARKLRPEEPGVFEDPSTKKFWKLELESEQPIEVVTQVVTFQPGDIAAGTRIPALFSSPS